MSLGSKWGTPPTNKSYRMFLKKSPNSTLMDLDGYSLTGVSQELSDKVTVTRTKVSPIFGRRTYNKVIKSAKELGRTYNIGFPADLSATFFKEYFKNQCGSDVFLKYNCPKDYTEEHAFVFAGAMIDDPVESNDFLVNDVSEEAIKYQSTLHVSDRTVLYGLQYYKLVDLTGVTNYVIFLNDEDCLCDNNFFDSMFSGNSSTIHRYTYDKWKTYVESPTIAGAANKRAGFRDGDLLLVSIAASKINTAAQITGSVLLSTDKGQNFDTATSITNIPINAFGKLYNIYIAAGGAGTGSSRILTSLDAIQWTEISSSVLSSTTNAPITALSVDESDNCFYAVAYSGADSLVYKVLSNGDFFSVFDITANLPSLTGVNLESVNVYSKGHIAVGGTNGYFAESFDGGVTWTKTFSGSSGTIWAIAGDEYRSFLSVNNSLYERSILTNYVYKKRIRTDGSTANVGTIYGITRGDENNWAVTTSLGIVMFLSPYSYSS